MQAAVRLGTFRAAAPEQNMQRGGEERSSSAKEESKEEEKRKEERSTSLDAETRRAMVQAEDRQRAEALQKKRN